MIASITTGKPHEPSLVQQKNKEGLDGCQQSNLKMKMGGFYMLKRLAVTSAALAAAFLFTGVASAEYPEKDIRVVVPWGAGGGTDGIVRKMSSIAEKTLPVSIFVENIEGGVSATGVMDVMKSAPDGYNLAALTYDSVITVPWQGLLSNYKMDQLKLIARITAEPDAIMVNSKSDYKTLDDLLAAAKANPGKIKIGVQGIGSRVHLAMLRIQDAADIKFNMISYPGGAAQQKEAILSNEIDALITSLGDFASVLQSGDVRGLAELSGERNAAFPDVPTAKELGYDIQVGSFIVLAAPAGTPEADIATLEKAYSDAYQGEEFQSFLKKVGVSPAWIGTEEVTGWAMDTQTQFFGIMQGLVDQGILKK